MAGWGTILAAGCDAGSSGLAGARLVGASTVDGRNSGISVNFSADGSPGWTCALDAFASTKVNAHRGKPALVVARPGCRANWGFGLAMRLVATLTGRRQAGC